MQFARHLWGRLSRVIFTVLGLVCLAAYFPRFQAELSKLSSPRDLQLAVGALIGTVLTLGFSLSIIPIQRAAEIYSPTIIRLFREARAIQLPFLALLLLCLASFASVLAPLVGLDPVETIPILILFVAISLDLLRQLYRAVTALLQPKEAVWRLEREAREFLLRLHRRLEQSADLAWRALPIEQQHRYTRESYIRAFYASNPVHDRTVESRAAELTEIAFKALDRTDLSLFFEAITALAELGIDSIEIRKSALTYAAVEFMVIKSNAGTLLDRIYEDLLDVNRAAIRRPAETASGQVVRVFSRIAQHMLRVHQEPPFAHSASLGIAPVLACSTAISECMAAGMDNLGYEGAAALAVVSSSAPVGSPTELHLHVLNGIFDVIKDFLAAPKKAFHVREPLSRSLTVVHSLLKKRDPSFDHVLGVFLNQLRPLIQAGITLETGQFGELIQLPFAPAFDVTVESSLPHLIRNSAASIKDDPQRSRGNAWSDFLKVCELVFRQYLNLAESPTLASSQLMFYLTQSVQMMASDCLGELARAHENQSAQASEIEGKISRLLAFFSSSAEHSRKVDISRAQEAAKCLGWIGLAALDIGSKEVVLSAARNIGSIAIAASTKSSDLSDQHVARLLMPLRLLRRLARILELPEVLDIIEHEANKAIASIARPQLTEVLNRLEPDLREYEHSGMIGLRDPNDPESLLVQIVRRRSQAAASE
jgi:hypothetical protein